MRNHISRIVHACRRSRRSSNQYAVAAAAASFPLAAAALACLVPLHASAKAPVKPAGPDLALVDNFSRLATMRPRTCPADAAAGIPAPGWRADKAQCAWQGLLRLQRWRRAADASPAACTSNAAQWWAQARQAYRGGAVPALAWHDSWDSQVLANSGDGVHRLALIARSGDGWTVSEWSWRPSARAATRRWQEGRWQLLLDAASRFRQPAPHPADRRIEQLQAAWERNLGQRAGAVRAGAWWWQSGGQCLKVEEVGVSQGQLRLPYLIEDSRLEQRSAMQLQLARRYPDAVWARTFRPVPAPAQAATPGSAKYEAIWQQGAQVTGQLWIPTRDDGPVLRLRVSTRLAGAGAAAAGQAAAAATAVERELAGLARQWDAGHE